ncbi:MAG: threonine aldolase family protein [Microthrixaceae bacterium]
MRFASDNTSGVCPEVLAALSEEASRSGPAYGADPASVALTEALGGLFEREVEVWPVATGTAANSLALAAACPPWGGVLCHRLAHIAVDELAAPTVIGGGITLFPLDGEDGKLRPEALAAAAARVDHDVHTVPHSALSLTQSTEVGTRYRSDEVAALATAAHTAGLTVHMDGARFANAVAATGASPADLTWRAGVDVLSFGATKGGALAAEALVVFSPDRVTHVDRHRKRFGHLLSKQRLVAAQFLGWLADDAWLRHADHANSMATRLGEGLVERGRVPSFPVETNMVFVPLADAAEEAAWRAGGAEFYSMPTGAGGRVARLVTSWSSTADEVDRFLDLVDTPRD